MEYSGCGSTRAAERLAAHRARRAAGSMTVNPGSQASLVEHVAARSLLARLGRRLVVADRTLCRTRRDEALLFSMTPAHIQTLERRAFARLPLGGRLGALHLGHLGRLRLYMCAAHTLARQTHVLTLSPVAVHRRAPHLHHRRRDPPRCKKTSRKPNAHSSEIVTHFKRNGAPQAQELGQQVIDAGGSAVGHCVCVWIPMPGHAHAVVDKTSFFLHVIDSICELVVITNSIDRALFMKRPGKVIYRIPRDTALDRIFKIGAQNLCVVNRLLQLVTNLDATGRLWLWTREGHGEHHFTLRAVFSLGGDATRARNQPRMSFVYTRNLFLDYPRSPSSPCAYEPYFVN